jgi:hypothetical protein
VRSRLVVACVALATIGLVPAHAGAKTCLSQRSLQRAARYAEHREGRVSFAFADECGRLVGSHRFRVHSSASVVKVMLLAAYLRQDDVRHHSLSHSERHLLGPMIKESNNRSAGRVFAAVGQGGLNDLAADAHMRRFVSSSSWGGSGITAGDQARFVQRLERFLPKRHEDYALGLMTRIIPKQTWGIPDVSPRGWRVHFKGGWYSADGQGHDWRVNQVATLRREHRRISLAVLSDGNNSFKYGRATVRGVARILLDDYARG